MQFIKANIAITNDPIFIDIDKIIYFYPTKDLEPSLCVRFVDGSELILVAWLSELSDMLKLTGI